MRRNNSMKSRISSDDAFLVRSFENLFENAEDPSFLLNTNAKIVAANRRAIEASGFKKKNLIGKPLKEIISPEIWSNTVQAIKNAVKGKSARFELDFTSITQKIHQLEVTVIPCVTHKETIGILGIVREVTKRKEMEEKLRSSETKLRALFENMPNGVFQSSPEGKIITANPTLVHMLGYNSLKKLLKVDIAKDLYANPKDRTEWQRKLEKKESLQNAELVLKRKDGQKLMVLENAHVVRDNQGKVLLYEGTLTDITERKIIEERLSALNFFSSKLNSAHNLHKVHELALDAMEKMLGFENAAFMIVDKTALRVGSQRGYHEPDLTLPLDGSKKGITVKTANLRKPIIVPDVKKNPDYVVGAPRIRSEIAIPVLAEDRVLGVLDVESNKLAAFNEQDAMLLQILASHAATAISNIEKRTEIEKRSNQLASLMRSSAEMIRYMDVRDRLEKIAEAITELGWRRVVIRAFRDADMEVAKSEDLVTAGLSKQEKAFLWDNRMPGQVWRERLGRDFERFKIGEFFYLPWSDPFVRKKFSQGTVSSHLKPEEMVDWNPDDLLYAPLRLAEGQVVGVLSIDDPVDGKRPTKESLAPLELFIHQAAVAVENAQLIQQLKDAKNQVRDYADQLEVKVKQRTKELVVAQKKLLNAERLAAIGEISAMVGHDLRNPLTGITGATYYLKMKLGSKIDEKSREMLEIIERDVEYSNKIVNDLLDYSREIHLELKETTPKSIVKGALQLVRIPRNVKLVDATKTEPKITADVGKMNRVFVNLIKNAIDAMPKGGTLRIESIEKSGELCMIFADTGAGMTDKVLKRLWSPLFTTKAKGMGFGLSICKRIIEAHDGSISVASTCGKGTTFTITVPIKPKVEGGGTVWVNVPESLLSMMTKA